MCAFIAGAKCGAETALRRAALAGLCERHAQKVAELQAEIALLRAQARKMEEAE